MWSSFNLGVHSWVSKFDKKMYFLFFWLIHFHCLDNLFTLNVYSLLKIFVLWRFFLFVCFCLQNIHFIWVQPTSTPTLVKHLWTVPLHTKRAFQQHHCCSVISPATGQQGFVTCAPILAHTGVANLWCDLCAKHAFCCAQCLFVWHGMEACTSNGSVYTYECTI